MAQKRSPKRLTINDLAAAVASLHEAMLFGFDRVDRRFAEVDARFESLEHGMERRFKEVDARFERLEHSMNKRFDRVDLRFDGIEGRLVALETARP